MARRQDKHGLKMAPDHGWRTKPGNVIVVLDRGAVRFDIPRTWQVDNNTSFPFTIYDKPQPDDDCRIQISFFRLPPGVDWSGLPLETLLTQTLQDDHRNVIETSEIQRVQRPGIEIAWAENRFMDPVLQREARGRTCLARGADIQPLITMEYWPEDGPRVIPVWDELLNSLRLGQYVKDPTKGPPIYH